MDFSFEHLFAFSFSSLIMVVLIDLVLSGDNALLIGMAARNLPKNLQKKAIFIGTSLAIILRLVIAAIISFLLLIPFLRLVGGVMLLWVAYKVLVGEENTEKEGGTTLLSAIKVIVLADVVMSLDNVLALAGVSHGSIMLIFIGVLISIPIIVWGSSFVIHLMERFKIIIYIGSGILAWSAAKMIIEEPRLSFFHDYTWLSHVFTLLCIVSVLACGYFANRVKKRTKTKNPN